MRVADMLLQATAKPAQPKTWKKKNAAARSRQDYKTIADVLNEVAERPLEQPKQTIIDMRGKQKRLVTNLEHLNEEQHENAGDLMPMPELQHNMSLLVDVAEADIQRIDGKLRHEKDTAVILGREQTRLQSEVEAAAAQVQRLNQILQTVSQCQSADTSVTITDIEQVYSRLKHNHREEYYMYNLPAAALAQALPWLTQLFASWSPLEDPSLGTAHFTRWRELLESEQQKRNAVFQTIGVASSDPYVQLCSAVVMPKLSRVVTNDWEPRNPEPMLQFMELWGPLLPGALQQQVLESLVFPKVGCHMGRHHVEGHVCAPATRLPMQPCASQPYGYAKDVTAFAAAACAAQGPFQHPLVHLNLAACMLHQSV